MTILCITGMHRSGTSLTASWLESCGLAIHDGNLMGSSTGNPKGHFEDQDFVDIHSSVIRLDNRRSNGWKVFAEKSLSFTDDQLARAHVLVRERNEKYSVWGWKDPRTVLFLDQWKEHVPELKVLFVWRPCSEVVDSLIERSKRATNTDFKVTLLESVKLWMYYNAKVCEYKQKHPGDTLLFNMDYVINHDRNVQELINEKLQLGLTYQPISNVYDPKLFHRKPGLLARIVSAYHGNVILEESLRNLSDA